MTALKKKTALRVAMLGVIAGLGMLGGTASSEAVVYCKAVGYPKGCIVRKPTVVYCTRVGYPKGCVVR
ncbi:hypothetical protein LB518_03700 [Mesorhizobium sp. BR1-1-16]|uniref:hypothetical protein n=1 Tax=Mesorhizobium sp. BR1-1-16 TaxID=2876653 RepID=UPI001CD01DCA|nr:hypothetical protein [Mesorhizobium sp. BR1-1-16]MBZ9935380.1 hypothetical protein [Mesorhizobium sp. BR1-1-16]